MRRLPIIAVLSPASLPDGSDSLDEKGFQQLARLSELPKAMKIPEELLPNTTVYFIDDPSKASAEHFTKMFELPSEPRLLRAWKGLSVSEIFLTAKELSVRAEFAVVFAERSVRTMLVGFFEEIFGRQSDDSRYAGAGEGDIVSPEETTSFREIEVVASSAVA